MSNEDILYAINEMLFKEENNIEITISDYQFHKGNHFQTEKSYQDSEEYIVHLSKNKIELDLNFLNCDLKKFEKYIDNHNGEFYFVVNGETEISKIERFRIENGILKIKLNESMFENSIRNLIDKKNELEFS